MTTPRWTTDDEGDLMCEAGDDVLLVLERRSPMRPHLSRTIAIDALAQCVRDADTLTQARRLAAQARPEWPRGTSDYREIDALLDLLAGDRP